MMGRVLACVCVVWLIACGSASPETLGPLGDGGSGGNEQDARQESEQDATADATSADVAVSEAGPDAAEAVRDGASEASSPRDAGRDTGADAKADAKADSGWNTCPRGQAPCGQNGACVGLAAWNGCGSRTCSPCPAAPQYGYAICRAERCEVACVTGFIRSGGACIPNVCPAQYAICDGSGTCSKCDPADCDLRCCRTDGSCGCMAHKGTCG
jgi:hypothetical protein